MSNRKEMARSEAFKTPICRVSYAQNLFEARKQNEKAAPKFGCTLIFKMADLPAIEQQVMSVLISEFGDSAVEKVKMGLLKSPILRGDGKEARNKNTMELHPGMGPDVFFIRPNANEDRPPALRYRSEQIPATKDEIYSGCYGFAVLNAYAYPSKDGGIPGVALGILYFQKTADGERLGGTGGPIDVSKYFEKISDEGAAPPETRAGAGAGGLFS